MNKLEIQSKILKDHKNDAEQLDVIQSSDTRLIVEAPAGFGKTTTLTSMIKYWLVTNQVNNFHKVLCLSYSISAANRMKKSVKQALLELNKQFFIQHVVTTNFHGLCRQILRKYGYLLSLPAGDSFDELSSTDTKHNQVYPHISFSEKIILDNFDEDVTNADVSPAKLCSNLVAYNEVIKRHFITDGIIPYNSIITFALELLRNFPLLNSYYKSYFSSVCVDEFQDTNLLGWTLIKQLTDDNNRLILFGDQMQQIYKFLGAIPHIIDRLIANPKFKYIVLKHNYRFNNNENLKRLDKNLRTFSHTLIESETSGKSFIPTIHGKDVKDEADQISSWIIQTKVKDPKATTVLLVSQVGKTTHELVKSLSQSLDTFDASFKDTNKFFRYFQDSVCLKYQQMFKDSFITIQTKRDFENAVSNIKSSELYGNSFLRLLNCFLSEAIHSYSGNSRSQFIISSLETYSLRHYINLVKAPLTISTIHGAKGLEWDYVIIANFEQNEFPNYPLMKQIGTFKDKNHFNYTEQNQDSIKDLLNEFYVAFSRARKNFIVSYSDQHWAGNLNNSWLTRADVSCLAHLPFIQLCPLIVHK